MSRRSAQQKLQVVDGILDLQVEGHILRRVPPIFDAFGIPATSTLELESKVQYALSDPDVEGLLLRISSPGGTLAGVQQLADLLRAARVRKPVHAHADDLAASAAYWIGAQASRFTASASAELGSIGVYTVVADESRLFEKAGVDVKVLRSGKHKGVGVVGSKITDEQLARIQAQIDAAADLFVQAVARGRGIPVDEVRELATGEAWFAEEAAWRGLIDGVESRERAFEMTKKAAEAMRLSPDAETRMLQIAVAEPLEKEEPMNLESILAKLDDDEQAFLRTLVVPAPEPDPIESVPEEVRSRFEEERQAREVLEQQVAELRERETSAQYREEAAALAFVPGMSMAEIAETLRAADARLPDEVSAKLRTCFAAVDRAMRDSALLESIGSSMPDDGSSPLSKLTARAKSIRKDDAALTDEQAFELACEQHPELYQAYRGEV